MMPYGVTRPQWVNTSLCEQNDRHIQDNIIFFSNYIFVEIFLYLFQMLLELYLKGPIDSNATLVQAMVCHRTGDEPFT